MEKLAKIQKELKAKKDQYNKFGGYNYRSAESILEAVKPLLDGAILTLQDDIVVLGNPDEKGQCRFYVKATAIFKDGDFTESTTAYAREPDIQKGMNESQITGSASSYARKYALNGLFCIDDNKDADTEEYHNQTEANKDTSTEEVPTVETIIDGINEKMTLDNWKGFYAKAIKYYAKGTPEYIEWSTVFNRKKKELEQKQVKEDLQEEADFLDGIQEGDITQDYYD